MENNKIHILIVDDDNRIRDLLKEYLKENNYIVSTSENAENAKIKLSHLKFDLIVLDVMMPGQNGYELTKEIKNKLKVPIILLTAKGQIENTRKGSKNKNSEIVINGVKSRKNIPIKIKMYDGFEQIIPKVLFIQSIGSITLTNVEYGCAPTIFSASPVEVFIIMNVGVLLAPNSFFAICMLKLT